MSCRLSSGLHARALKPLGAAAESSKTLGCSACALGDAGAE